MKSGRVRRKPATCGTSSPGGGRTVTTRKVEIVNFTDEEHELMTKHGLNAGQIAFRREMRSQFRNRFLEEYAENAETCFLTSGNCMFDCEA